MVCVQTWLRCKTEKINIYKIQYNIIMIPKYFWNKPIKIHHHLEDNIGNLKGLQESLKSDLAITATCTLQFCYAILKVCSNYFTIYFSFQVHSGVTAVSFLTKDWNLTKNFYTLFFFFCRKRDQTLIYRSTTWTNGTSHKKGFVIQNFWNCKHFRS